MTGGGKALTIRLFRAVAVEVHGTHSSLNAHSSDINSWQSGSESYVRLEAF